MIRNKSLRLRGTAVSAAVVFLFSSSCFVSETAAQSDASAAAGSSLSSPAPAPFLVAPSIPLGYAPSGVATGDLRRSGTLDLVTADYNSGKITVFLGSGQGKFASGAGYDAGLHPSAVLVADINGDGRPDVLVCNESEGTISVLFGNGDGTLQARRSYAAGLNPSFMAAGDFGGSGKLDLAVAGRSGSLLAILLNDGDGNLQKPVLSSLSKTPTALSVADFDNDGRADLALANADGSVSILLGKGAGLFRSLPDIAVASGSLSSINSGDLNKDGKIDLVVTQPGQKLVSVLIGKGDGSFATPASYAVGNEPVSTLVADVNGDGVPALVVINKSSNTFSILGGNGDGTFKTPVDFVAGNAPLAAVAGDFYGNGNVDLAIINHSSQTVSVPPGNGDGTFKAARSYPSGVQPVSIVSGNLNGGKIPALVVANYCGSDHTCGTTGNVAVFLADDKGVYRLSSTYPVGSGPVSVALASLKGDKNLDIVALNRLDKTASVLLGAGDGTFRQPITFSLAGAPIALAVGDLNKDGKLDLAVLEDCGSAKCSQAGSLEILLGEGDGSFQSAASYTVGYSPVSVAVGALHGDKNLDLVVANRCGKDASCQSAGTATVLIGDGTGKFAPGTEVALGHSPASIALGNLTGSGLDLVVSRSTDNTVAVLRGNGDGTFKAAVPYHVGAAPGPLVVADFNGDGRADVAVANVNDSTVSVLFGRGDGTLQAAGALAVGSGPTSLTVVGRATGRHASLATTNGGGGSSSLGTEFTVLPNLQTDPPLASFVLAVSPTPTSNVNDAVQLTATLTGVSPNAAPTGTVTFDSDPGTGPAALSDCTGVLITQGVSPSLISTATCTTHMLTAGTDSLTAVYSGDAIYDTGVGETSPAMTQTVAQLSPSLTFLATTPGSSTSVNQTVTFSAALGTVAFTPITPTNTVNFTVGTAPATTISGCGTAALVLSAGKWTASCTTNALAAGNNQTIGAVYVGDANFQTASAPTITQSVVPFAATINVGTTPTAVNRPVAITAQLAGTGIAFTPTPPSGTFNFMVSIGGAPLATITGCGAVSVNATGGASCPWTPPAGTAASTYPISVTYTGDSNFTTAAAGTATQTFIPFAATINVTGPGTTPVVNSSVTLTAQLAGTGIAFTPTAPAGKFTFSATINGTPTTLCSGVTVDATGGASCPTTALVAPSDAISVTYSGDSNFTTAAAGTTTQNVAAFAATINVTGPGTTPVVNTSVTLTAQLAGAGIVFTPTAPAGKFTFSATIDGTPTTLCTGVTVSATGGASCATTALVAPSDAISVTYSGDTNFTTAAAGTTTQNIAAYAATIHVTGPGATTVNTPVTLAAQLAGTGIVFTPTAPSGKFNFSATIDGTPTTLCSGVTATATGGANCQTSLLVAPSDAISVTYSGDPNFTTAAAGTMTQNETKVASTVTVSTTTPSVAAGASVTFTAQVGPAGSISPVAPTGIVSFLINGNPSSDCTPVTLTSASAGAATCTTSSLLVPADSITATYAGDGNFTGPVTSAKFFETVGQTPAVVAFTPAVLPATDVNQQTTITATVAPPTKTGSTVLPTGSVMFKQGTTILCSAVTISTTTGAASCPYTFTSSATGGLTISAIYSGDSNYSAGNTPSATQVVNLSPTTTTVVSSPASSAVTQTVAFTATVMPKYPTTPFVGQAVPSGTVTFTISPATTPAQQCVETIVSGAVPVCNFTFNANGSYTVTATYSGDGNFTAPAGSAGTDTQSVGTGTTSVVVSSNGSTTPAAVAVNQKVTLSTVINSAATATVYPQGTMTYTDTLTGNSLCTVNLVAGVAPVCPASFATVGTHPITAEFTASASSVFSSSPTSAVLNQVVTQAQSTTTVSSLAPAGVNQAVTFTATVAQNPAATPSSGATVSTPTGTVTFTYAGEPAGTSLCSYTLGTQSSCKSGFPTAGTFTVTATYSGDSNFVTSAGTAPITVNAATTSVVFQSSLPTSVVSQLVTFTAYITPTTPPGGNEVGPVAPTGTVAFTSSDGVLNGYTACATAPLTATKANPTLNIPAGSSIATCTVQFPITEPLGTGTTVATNCSKTPPSGQVCVTATYNGDTNFGMATYNFAQVVQNYGVAFTAPAAGTPVIVTQDFSNATDLFNPAPIAAQVTSSGGFSDPLTVTCSVTAVSVANIPAGQAVSDPSCAPSSAALSGVSGSTLTYSISASTTAPIGAYSVQLTATDLNTKAGYSISQSTMASLTVDVVGQTPALTLAQGATGAESLVFNTSSAASGSTLLSFGCGKIFTSDGVSVPNPSNAPVVTCTDSSIPSGGVPVGSNGLTTVPIQVSLATTTAQINRSSTVSLAALLGVPLLALIGWFGSRKSPRRNFFRFIGLILLMAGAAYAVTGCGGSFTQTGGIPGQGGLGKGTYLVQVIAYDGSKQTGNQYYAVVPLTVTANSAQ